MLLESRLAAILRSSRSNPCPPAGPGEKKTIEIKKAVKPIAAEILIGKRALPVEIKRV